MNPLIPVWILGGPFLGLIVLSFVFKGQSAMGGTGIRYVRRVRDGGYDDMNDLSAPITDPMHPAAPRRIV